MRRFVNTLVPAASRAFIPLVIILCGYALGQTVERLPDDHPKSRIVPGLAYSLPPNPHHSIVLPRIIRFPNASLMKAVNEDLRSEERSLRAQRSDCFKDHMHEAFWEHSSRVAVLTRDVFSIENKAFAYCGGTHPFENYEPLTYNMRTGKRFDFDRDSGEIFIAGELPVDDLIDLYKRHYPSDAGDCKASMIEPKAELFLHFEPTGLAILPNLPHVIAACGPEITVPYSELRPLLKSGNPFRGLIGP